MSNDNNIIEFTLNDDNTRHTTDSVLDHLMEYRDDIVSLTCVVEHGDGRVGVYAEDKDIYTCLLYTSPSPRDLSTSRMPSSA